MTGELPEGIDLDDVRSHAMHLSIAGTLINLSGAYLTSADGTPEEAEAEHALNEFVDRTLDLGPQALGATLLVLGSLITQTGDEPTVQSWFDDQGKHIAAALSTETPDD